MQRSQPLRAGFWSKHWYFRTGQPMASTGRSGWPLGRGLIDAGFLFPGRLSSPEGGSEAFDSNCGWVGEKVRVGKRSSSIGLNRFGKGRSIVEVRPPTKYVQNYEWCLVGYLTNVNCTQCADDDQIVGSVLVGFWRKRTFSASVKNRVWKSVIKLHSSLCLIKFHSSI